MQVAILRPIQVSQISLVCLCMEPRTPSLHNKKLDSGCMQSDLKLGCVPLVTQRETATAQQVRDLRKLNAATGVKKHVGNRKKDFDQRRIQDVSEMFE